MIFTSMKDHNSTKWSESLSYVQFMTNRSHHAGIKRTPCEAMFGCSPKVGLYLCTLFKENYNNITTEEVLDEILNKLSQPVETDTDDNVGFINETESVEINSDVNLEANIESVEENKNSINTDVDNTLAENFKEEI